MWIDGPRVGRKHPQSKTGNRIKEETKHGMGTAIAA